MTLKAAQEARERVQRDGITACLSDDKATAQTNMLAEGGQ